MPRIEIPKDTGKVRVAMSLGGKFTVWNGKQGRGEFSILCRDRKQAEEICRKSIKKSTREKLRSHFDPMPVPRIRALQQPTPFTITFDGEFR